MAPPRLCATASLGVQPVWGGAVRLLVPRQRRRLLLSFPALQLPLHEGVEEAGPGLVLAVVAQVRPDGLSEVQEHVPGVSGDAAHARRVLGQEVKPALQDGRCVLREDEVPQGDGDVALQRALALVSVQAELEGEAVQVLEALLALRLQQQEGKAGADALDAVCPDGLTALHKLLPDGEKPEQRMRAGHKASATFSWKTTAMKNSPQNITAKNMFEIHITGRIQL